MNEYVERAKELELPEDIVKWIELLTNGEYKQCDYKLSDGKGFCCLGVYGHGIMKKRLRDIVSLAEENDARVHISEVYRYTRDRLETLNLRSGEYSSMNDMGDSFTAIAKTILDDYEFELNRK